MCLVIHTRLGLMLDGWAHHGVMICRGRMSATPRYWSRLQEVACDVLWTSNSPTGAGTANVGRHSAVLSPSCLPNCRIGRLRGVPSFRNKVFSRQNSPRGVAVNGEIDAQRPRSAVERNGTEHAYLSWHGGETP